MKHNKFERIFFSVVGNAIFIGLAWITFQSPIWNAGRDFWVEIFAIIGLIAILFLINYAIELNTRVKDKK
ncbi:MAG: hypothetical protein ABSB31_08790 [Dehalococcoidia bacterium]|jgi:hypothetical protein